MTENQTLVSRVRALGGHDDSYARSAIREIAKWLEDYTDERLQNDSMG